MTFYHVGRCDCPTGRCDCGSVTRFYVFSLLYWNESGQIEVNVKSASDQDEVDRILFHNKAWRNNPHYKWKTRFNSVVPAEKYATTKAWYDAMLQERLK